MENTVSKLLAILLIVVFAVGFFHIVVPVTHASTFVVSRVIYASTSDGQLVGYHATDYTAAHNLASATFKTTTAYYMGVGQENTTDNDHYIYRSYLYFDTAIIPDLAINANLTLSVMFYSVDGADNITIQTDTTIYPHVPLQYADYSYTYYSGNSGTMNVSALSPDTYYNITMTNSSMLNKQGYTTLCLRSNRDINSVVSTDKQLVYLYTAENGDSQCARLYVTYETTEFYQYYLFGGFNEDGSNAGAINVTFYRPTQPLESFTLNGEHNVTCEENHRMVFRFDQGDNLTRIYYVYAPTESIYVVKVGEPTVINYFFVVDYIGISDAYLESMININGAERVIERWRIDKTTGLVPFTMTFGATYTMRLVCNKGTYVFGSWTAQSSGTEKDYVIDSTVFPTAVPDSSGIAVYATRKNVTWIQAYFNDTLADTYWVEINITLYGESIADYSLNTTSYPVTVNWMEAGSEEDYFAVVTINHTTLGLRQYSFPCPAPTGNTNPFTSLAILGTFPFALSQLPAVILLLVLSAAFSYWSLPMGIFVSFIMALFLAWLGWLAVGWAWLTIAGFICFILIFSEVKEREQT